MVINRVIFLIICIIGLLTQSCSFDRASNESVSLRLKINPSQLLKTSNGKVSRDSVVDFFDCFSVTAMSPQLFSNITNDPQNNFSNGLDEKGLNGSACSYFTDNATSQLFNINNIPEEIAFSSLVPGTYLVKIIGVEFSEEYDFETNGCEGFDDLANFGKSFKRAYLDGSYEELLESVEEVGRVKVEITGESSAQEETVSSNINKLADALCLEQGDNEEDGEQEEEVGEEEENEEEEGFNPGSIDDLYLWYHVEGVELDQSEEIAGINDSAGVFDGVDLAVHKEGGEVHLLTEDDDKLNGYNVIEFYSGEGGGSAFFKVQLPAPQMGEDSHAITNLFTSSQTAFTLITVMSSEGEILPLFSFLDIDNEGYGMYTDRVVANPGAYSTMLDYGINFVFGGTGMSASSTENIFTGGEFQLSTITMLKSDENFQFNIYVNQEKQELIESENFVDAPALYPDSNYKLRIGGVESGGASTNRFVEVILYSRELTGSEREDVEAYLVEKYALDFSLTNSFHFNDS